MGAVVGVLAWKPTKTDGTLIAEILKLANEYGFENILDGPDFLKYQECFQINKPQIAVRKGGLATMLMGGSDKVENSMKAFLYDAQKILSSGAVKQSESQIKQFS